MPPLQEHADKILVDLPLLLEHFHKSMGIICERAKIGAAFGIIRVGSAYSAVKVGGVVKW